MTLSRSVACAAPAPLPKPPDDPNGGYVVDEDSDEYGAMSSDEELDDPLLNGVGGEAFEGDEDSDDFEKEMDAEIQQTMQHKLPPKPGKGKGKGDCKKEKEPVFYDDVYFNSSDEECEKQDKRIKTDEELFYDPGADDKDEQWVQNKRKNYLDPGTIKKIAPGCSATLCCPACMTVVCRDCQQHADYHHQFRAMFVFDCLVVANESLAYKIKEKKRRKRGAKQEEPQEQEMYNPVKCAVCETKIGVYDKDEVYHFFNVLAT